MPDPRPDLLAKKARIEAEIEKLEKRHWQLDMVRDEFAHEARRAGDALERLGGRSSELEARVASLLDSEKLTEADLAKTAEALDGLKRRLAEIERLDRS
jgi:chromosome segregation ATPase